MAAWLRFSLLALAFWGVWGFLGKVAVLYLPARSAYLLAITGHLAVIGYLFFWGGLAIPWHAAGVAAALGAGLCMAFGLLCFFRALAHGAASQVVPLTGLYPLVTVSLSWLLLREGFNLRRLAGVALALMAVWLLSK